MAGLNEHERAGLGELTEMATNPLSPPEGAMVILEVPVASGPRIGGLAALIEKVEGGTCTGRSLLTAWDPFVTVTLIP
jgi:hypothetical protein